MASWGWLPPAGAGTGRCWRGKEGSTVGPLRFPSSLQGLVTGRKSSYGSRFCLSCSSSFWLSTPTGCPSWSPRLELIQELLNKKSLHRAPSSVSPGTLYHARSMMWFCHVSVFPCYLIPAAGDTMHGCPVKSAPDLTPAQMGMKRELHVDSALRPRDLQERMQRYLIDQREEAQHFAFADPFFVFSFPILLQQAQRPLPWMFISGHHL